SGGEYLIMVTFGTALISLILIVFIALPFSQVAEKESGLTKQIKYLETISDLEENISGMEKRAFEAESEDRYLMNKLSRLKSENDAGILRYGKCLEKNLVLEKKIVVTEDEARTYSQQAAQLDVQCLTNELLNSTQKLKSVEEICVRLESSNKSLKTKATDLPKRIMLKDKELSHKHDEMEKLQSYAKNEHTHYVQTKAALETSQILYTQSQEEQRNLVLELKNGLQMVKDLEICKLDKK
nr:protein NETWORKED 1A [Tanacetum cinerariifolium]